MKHGQGRKNKEIIADSLEQAQRKKRHNMEQGAGRDRQNRKQLIITAVNGCA